MLTDPVLVAGLAALDGAMPSRTDPGFLSRVPLCRSGVLQADGSQHPLATATFRHRRYAPLAGRGVPAVDLSVDGTSIFGGIVSQHFGHVVTQGLGRLWAGALAPDAPILFLPETLGVTALPGYLTDLARALGVTNPLQIVTRSTRCARLLVPSDICNLSRRPTVTPFCRDWLARHRPSALAALTGRVYVSRSRLGPQHGQFLQETLLETALTASGYAVFHPQEHPINRQIETYMAAERLIFADGSAAHLWSLVARAGQKAAVVLRRPRDREYARWFRSFEAPVPHYIDCVIADFWRRGDGPGRSVALLDLEAVWRQLHALGYHDDSGRIRVDRPALDGWVASLPLRQRGPLAGPPELDRLSQDILARRRHAALRHRPAGP